MEKEQTFKQGVRGFVKPGFEPVLWKFEELHQNGNDINSQLCIYVGEEVVIDLYSNKTEKFNGDTPLYQWSTGKCVGSILMGIQRERGAL